MTLVATPGDPAANTYVSAAEAAALLDLRLDGETWLEADLLDQERALRWATRLLDQLVDWDGTPRFTTQALGWPRRGVMAETELFRATSVAGAGTPANFSVQDATVTGPAGSFSAYQVGQWLTLSGGTQAANRGTWQIASLTTTSLTFAHVTFTTADSQALTLTGLTNAETIPEAVRWATAEYALALHQAYGSSTQTSTSSFTSLQGLKSFQDGTLRLEFADGGVTASTSTVQNQLPRHIATRLARYGLVAGGGMAFLSRV